MNAIELNGLTKHYKDFTLDGVTLTLPCGCIMGLIGENGAGKSTTIKLLLGMLRSDGGTVRLLGKDQSEALPLALEEVGVVLDEPGISGCLTPKQVGEIMSGIYRNWDATAYENYLRRLSLPEGKKYKEFSRGMKMKLGIAVALSHHPKLLVLDEATSGLDPVVRDEVLDIFSEFTRDAEHAVLISSHIVSDLEKICDYIAFLHKGKLMLCEEKDRLLEQYAIVRCSAEELSNIVPAAVIGKKQSAYGAEAIALREAIPAGLAVSPVELEQLFIFMVKEAR